MSAETAQATAAENQPPVILGDEVPYESYTYRKTHPDHLYMIGRLRGLSPPDYKKARVLELGSAGGGNLAPFAYENPDSECYGIDLSRREISAAEDLKNAFGIDNVTFEYRDIMDLSRDKDGRFDYVICHGIISWVPPEVRTKIFEICRDMLTDKGMALISYNAYPGWRYVQPIRDMMQYYTQGIDDKKAKVKKAHRMLAFFAEHMPANYGAPKAVFSIENNLLKNTFEDFILHDHLGDINFSYYFHEFAAALAAHDLQYVNEAEFAFDYAGGLDPEVQTQIKNCETRIQKLQMLDFLRNVRFRTSVISRTAQKIDDSRLDRDTLQSLFYTLKARPADEEPAPESGKVSYYFNNSNMPTEIEGREINEILLEFYYNGAFPASIGDVISRVVENTDLTDKDALMKIALRELPSLIESDCFSVYAEKTEAVPTISDKPEAYKPARIMAQTHPKITKLISATRNTLDTEIFVNLLLAYLDGTHTVDALGGKMMEHLKAGDFSITDKNGLIVHDEKQQRIGIETRINKALNQLCDNAALVG